MVTHLAGLDFLEAHIIRQDQVVEGLQKQMVTVSCTLETAALPCSCPGLIRYAGSSLHPAPSPGATTHN